MRPRQEPDNLAGLLETISDALRALPGSRALDAFGSLTDERRDNFSDIDLRLITDDLALSLASRHAVLRRVRPIALEWTIDCTDTSWAATILFDGVSPFHKLDIDISAAGSRKPVGQPEFVRLWEGDARSADPPQDLTRSQLPYTPALGSIQHFTLGQLLGVTRYVKARKRGRVFTSWRFASALIDAMLALRYMQAFPGERIDRKLLTGEYLKLDQAADIAERDRFFGRLDMSSPEVMDGAVHQTALEVIALGDELARDAPIPPALITLFSDFLNAELPPR